MRFHLGDKLKGSQKFGKILNFLVIHLAMFENRRSNCDLGNGEVVAISCQKMKLTCGKYIGERAGEVAYGTRI